MVTIDASLVLSPLRQRRPACPPTRHGVIQWRRMDRVRVAPAGEYFFIFFSYCLVHSYKKSTFNKVLIICKDGGGRWIAIASRQAHRFALSNQMFRLRVTSCRRPCGAIFYPPFAKKSTLLKVLIICKDGGGRWIRTIERRASRFTVCPLWPLGNPTEKMERVRGVEPL